VAYTSEQLGAFRAEASRRRKKASLVFLAMSLPLYGVMFSFAGGQALGMGLAQWVGIWVVVAVVALLSVLSIFRCPACNSRFGIGKVQCPACGVSLGKTGGGAA
jgi:drug/metabolite transporter superfamily protein YnfA